MTLREYLRCGLTSDGPQFGVAESQTQLRTLHHTLHQPQTARTIMAEAIGVASGLVGLGTFALQSSVALYETINSYRSHQQRVRDLADETSALSGVLGSLVETVQAAAELDLSALEIPLRQCGKACQGFEEQIQKCSSRSTSSRTSVKDWARLRYNGDDIDGFRRLLASYKSTITIALTHATL